MISPQIRNSKSELRNSTPPSLWQYANPRHLLGGFIRHRELLLQCTRREIEGRYRGSHFGVLWALLTPLLMLGVFTFVFSVIFQARWEIAGSETHTGVALIIFTGMIAFNVFSECANSAPHLILNNRNYVKKVVFPLEILPASVLGSSLVHSFFSLAVVITGLLFLEGHVHWSVVYLPLCYVPLAAFSLGAGWFLSSLGVFLHDLGSLVPVVTQLWFFLTPIVYPATAIPPSLRPWLLLNPLTVPVDSLRRVLLWGQPPDWSALGLLSAGSLVFMLAGYAWFMKIKGAFADVI